MKKTKLNLLTSRENYQGIEKIFAFIRIFFFIQLSILVVLFAFLFISAINQNSKIGNLLSQKESFLESLKNKEGNEAQLFYIQNKYQSLKDFLKEDARSLPYYNLLNSALSKSSESATLKSFLISKNRDVTFTVSFAHFDELLSFFRFIESDKFLSNFEKVSLKSFSALGDSKERQNYELAFTGRFIELHEATN
jgi:hypothetical protein